MAMDGVFLHFLIEELKPRLINKRINKINTISDREILFSLPYKESLWISIHPNNPQIRLTEKDYIGSHTPLTQFLKKHIESSIITNIHQVRNDRIIILDVRKSDDLGYQKIHRLIFELTGRFSNFIITDENYVILEALKKSYLTDERVILPKAVYPTLESGKLNPFESPDSPLPDNDYEGVSKDLYTEICMKGSLSLLRQKVNPTLILGKRITYHAWDLSHIEGERIHFATLLEMLEHYSTLVSEEVQNKDQINLAHFLNKEIQKRQKKLEKQELELRDAYVALEYEKIANILAANIHLVKPYQEEITVENFYTGEPITLSLNTSISVNENINYYFNKYKKAKRTITNLATTIEETKNDISYYQLLASQMQDGNNNDLQEILIEVGIKKPVQKQQKPKITRYTDQDGNTFFVGKNNTQNEYLTHTLASPSDYFFHVLDYPGSHVILRGDLTTETIYNASLLASFYSKSKGKVTVDYTQVKWVKKIKGRKGSFVRYTNQKSVVVEGNLDEILSRLTLHK